MLPQVRLVKVIRDDVGRMEWWLRDAEVNDSWYGTDKHGEPLHIGYSPGPMLRATDREWEETFGSEVRRICSVLSAEEGHVGEGQMVIEPALYEAQLFILIGRKELWCRPSAIMGHIGG